MFKEEENGEEDESRGYSYKDMMRRDQRRWAKADHTGDGDLSKDEFQNFLHPEESESLKDVIIDVRLFAFCRSWKILK